VTVAEYERFLADHPQRRNAGFPKSHSPEAGCPMIWVSWYDAVAYCNWLSQKEGIPRSQWCYPDKIGEGTKLYPDHLSRTGYRLPTEAEWEYAARAGSAASRYYGSSAALLPRYAHHLANGANRCWPVGQKRPNDLGLFDVLGNAWAWCDNPPDFSSPPGRAADKERIRDIPSGFCPACRAGSFGTVAEHTRSAYRFSFRAEESLVGVGLRVCRTYHPTRFP
jgi:formylglycine-generating enzyme required for sulfatase activity